MKNNTYVQDVPLKELKIDYSYQRGISSGWLKKIIANYDPSLVRQLTLSKRANGDLYILDGHHTVDATLAVIGEHACLPAKIFNNLTIEEEAELFNRLNTNSKKVRYGEKLKARVRSNEEKACRYVEALDKSGIDWAYVGGGKDGPYESHKEGEYLLSVYGDKVLVNALKVLHASNNHKIYTGYVLGGICYLLKYTKINHSRLINKLSNADEKNIRAKIALYGTSRSNYGIVRDRASAKAILDDYYNKHLSIGNKVELPNI